MISHTVGNGKGSDSRFLSEVREVNSIMIAYLLIAKFRGLTSEYNQVLLMSCYLANHYTQQHPTVSFNKTDCWQRDIFKIPKAAKLFENWVM